MSIDEPLPQWDPGQLWPDDRSARASAKDVAAELDSFASRYPHIFDADPAEVRIRLDSAATLREQVQRLAAYGAVRFAVAVSDPAANDISSDIDTVAAVADGQLTALVEQWRGLDGTVAARYLGSPALTAYRGALASARTYQPPLPVADVAAGLTLREPLADAWADMYELILAQVVVTIDGREVAVDDALSLRQSTDRKARRALDGALQEALRGSVDLVAHCYDTVVADRLMMDEVTGCPNPRHLADLANQIDTGAVDAALTAVAARSDVAHRWYAGKAASLGEDSLPVADLMAPVGEALAYSFPQARDIVVTAWSGLDTDLGGIARDLFRTSRIDALPRPGKMGNSLCIPAGSAGAFILTNFTGTVADVFTLAHEVGHALHYTLSGRTQSGLTSEPTVLAGEVAANFAELLIADEMLRHAGSEAQYAAITTASVDALVGTVFRQAAYTRFEQSAYARRAAGEILLTDRLAELWTDSLRPLYGSVVTGHETHTADWALVPHFIRSRFYNYAYVVATLAALTLYQRYKNHPADAATVLRRMLDAGGSADAADLLRPLGIDCADPAGWHHGLDALDQLVRDRLTR